MPACNCSLVRPAPSLLQVDGAVLSWFDSDGFDKLSPFRFLPAERRAAAAQYIVDNNLDPPVSDTQCSINRIVTHCSSQESDSS